MMHQFKQELKKLKIDNNLRKSLTICNVDKNHILVHGNKKLNFSSNDYLSLSSSSYLKKKYSEGINNFGTSSSSSPLISGKSEVHESLEEQLCAWQGYEAAILFNSGYSANQALIRLLTDQDTLLLQDRLNHASLIEEGILSPSKMFRFKHNDVEHLKTLLDKQFTHKIVITEGIFSMDGDFGNIKEIHNILKPSENEFIVDEAHSVGVIGKEGKGISDFLGIKPNIKVITFGKAFGLSGAAILCDSELKDYFENKSKHYIYSTYMQPALAFALMSALKIVRTDNHRRLKLVQLSEAFHDELSNRFQVVSRDSPIISIITGSNVNAIKLSEFLLHEGFLIFPIRPPTVPKNMSRIRITLNYSHKIDDVLRLAKTLNQYKGTFDAK
ncbi:8-amino-7-oxononanoate synthase [Paraphotobacterium marinum]|uniref:8-amino-7-oxononanoate synthase n=1 Tax=Paraphotobacterium marinum TaxID=1755811 RepID=A0A220VED4_9GAMM|nr:aminotransferase class I/II-fold pyridoxal phosphate-dependent enzyme [Paraphotobacterium marinum]ASK78651.1 8-amino-7-oxononanoate synthase [Paraphotobacterium marinum]